MTMDEADIKEGNHIKNDVNGRTFKVYKPLSYYHEDENKFLPMFANEQGTGTPWMLHEFHVGKVAILSSELIVERYSLIGYRDERGKFKKVE